MSRPCRSFVRRRRQWEADRRWFKRRRDAPHATTNYFSRADYESAMSLFSRRPERLYLPRQIRRQMQARAQRAVLDIADIVRGHPR